MFSRLTYFSTLLFTGLLISCGKVEQPKCYEGNKYLSDSTFSYTELIDLYQCMAANSDFVILNAEGETDSGEDLYSLVISADPIDGRSVEEIKRNKHVIFINNGIHPGESCGVDASVKLIRKYIEHPEKLKDVVVVIVPIYNVGGALDRRRVTRMNQDGPIGQGFRGNAQNLDLNRDLIKAEAKNTMILHHLLNLWKPLVFVDTHSTNGADYQYEMTLIESPYSKYPSSMGNLMRGLLHDEIYKKAEQNNVLLAPYVNVFGRSPEPGFDIFHETPIYTTGYTSSIGIYSYVTEAHMLKPYLKRVVATYVLLEGFVEIINEHGAILEAARVESYKTSPKYLAYSWAVDHTDCDSLLFKGFEEEFETSSIGSWERRKFNRSRPFERYLKYCGTLMPVDSNTVPKGYIIERGWSWLGEYLSNQGVEFQTLEAGVEYLVEGQKIKSFKSLPVPYEGHFVHTDLEVEYLRMKYTAKSGDLYVQTTPQQARLLWEILEAKAEGSLMRWNAFDAVLQAKEGFSDYVFEDTAIALLNRLPSLRGEFDSVIAANPAMRRNKYECLQWIYQHSAYFEPRYGLVPVYRVF